MARNNGSTQTQAQAQAQQDAKTTAVILTKGNTFTSKNPELARLTESIVAQESSAIKSYKGICIDLHTISKNPDFLKEDGFKTVAEYGNKVFGYGKSSVSKMIQVAEKWLLADDDATKRIAGLLPYSIMSETTVMSAKAITQAVKDGTINENTTQKQAREVASKAKADTAKIVKPAHKYNVKLAVMLVATETVKLFEMERVTLVEVDEKLEDMGFAGVLKGSLHKPVKANDSDYNKGVNVYFSTGTGDTATAVYSKYIEAKEDYSPKAQPGNVYTQEQVEVMLADARKQALAEVEANKAQ